MAEFDTQKGAFYLVAVIICTQMAMSLIVVTGCVLGITIDDLPVGTCDKVGQPLLEMFQMSFTAAIAFASGRASAPKVPEYKLPEKDKGDKDVRTTV